MMTTSSFGAFLFVFFFSREWWYCVVGVFVFKADKIGSKRHGETVIINERRIRRKPYYYFSFFGEDEKEDDSDDIERVCERERGYGEKRGRRR